MNILLLITEQHLLDTIRDTIVHSNTSTQLKEVSTNLFLLPNDKNGILSYVTPFISIISFFLGFFVNKWNDSYKEKKRINRVGERWQAEILCLEDPIKTQISNFESFLTEFRIADSHSTPNPQIQSLLSCDIFSSLDKSDLLKFLEEAKPDFKQAVKSANRTHGFIAILISINSDFKEKFSEYKTNYSAYSKDLSSNLSSLIREFGRFSILLEAENPTKPPKYFGAIQKLFEEQVRPHQETGRYNPFILEREFFIPLLDVLKEIRLDPRISEMTLYISKCLTDIKGFRMERGYLDTNITNIMARYSEQLKKIPEVAKELDSNPRSLWERIKLLRPFRKK